MNGKYGKDTGKICIVQKISGGMAQVGEVRYCITCTWNGFQLESVSRKLQNAPPSPPQPFIGEGGRKISVMGVEMYAFFGAQ